MTATGTTTRARALPTAAGFLAGDRTPRLLDVLMGLSVVGGLATDWAIARDGRVGAAWTFGYLAVVLAMAGLWVARRRHERRTGRPGRALVVALAVLSLVNLVLGGGSGAWPLFLMALVATVGCFGLRGGFALSGAVLVLQLVVALDQGASTEDALLEVGATAFVAAFGVLLTWLLTERVRQQRRIEALLAEVQQSLAAEVELVLADERTRAARDLHDGLGHRLTLIGMELTYAERVREGDPDAAWAQVGEARAGAAEALTSMRRWVRALSPARIEHDGLAGGLDALAESFRGTGLDVVVRDGSGGGADPVLGRGATLFVHRFVQESLTNALRHADAGRIEVGYAVDGPELCLSVTDDGSPGDPARPLPPVGFGLRNLTERAAELGGAVTRKWTAEGLQVSARLPLAETRP